MKDSYFTHTGALAERPTRRRIECLSQKISNSITSLVCVAVDPGVSSNLRRLGHRNVQPPSLHSAGRRWWLGDFCRGYQPGWKRPREQGQGSRCRTSRARISSTHTGLDSPGCAGQGGCVQVLKSTCHVEAGSSLVRMHLGASPPPRQGLQPKIPSSGAPYPSR